MEGNPERRDALILSIKELCLDTELVIPIRDVKCIRTLIVMNRGPNSVVDVHARRKGSVDTHVKVAGFCWLHI